MKGENQSTIADEMWRRLHDWYEGDATRGEIESFIRYGNLSVEELKKLEELGVHQVRGVLESSDGRDPFIP